MCPMSKNSFKVWDADDSDANAEVRARDPELAAEIFGEENWDPGFGDCIDVCVQDGGNVRKYRVYSEQIFTAKEL